MTENKDPKIAPEVVENLSRRDFIERATKLGILGVSGSLLIHDVSQGMALPQDVDPSQDPEPVDCECSCACNCECSCHCACACACDCSCKCSCTCAECTCGCVCPPDLKQVVQNSNTANINAAASNTARLATGGASIDGNQKTIFQKLEGTTRNTQRDANGKALDEPISVKPLQKAVDIAVDLVTKKVGGLPL